MGKVASFNDFREYMEHLSSLLSSQGQGRITPAVRRALSSTRKHRENLNTIEEWPDGASLDIEPGARNRVLLKGTRVVYVVGATEKSTANVVSRLNCVFDAVASAFFSQRPTVLKFQGIDNRPRWRLSLADSQHAALAEENRSPLEEWVAKERRLLHYPGGHVRSMWLWGASSEFVPRSRVTSRYEHKPLSLPEAVVEAGKQWIEKKRGENKDLFDGPNVRLIGWKQMTEEGRGREGAELPVIDLTFGPVGWFEYEGTNGRLRDDEQLWQAPMKSVHYYVDFKALKDGKIVTRLSNIVGIATTIITRDGMVGYQVRGSTNSARPNTLSSSVAENINRFKDDYNFATDSLVNPSPFSHIEQGQAGNDYQPRGICPFASVRRGIEEEVSPRTPTRGIVLTGIVFELESLQPDLLFVAAVDLDSQEVLGLAEREPGIGSREGDLKFTRASFKDSKTQEVLALPNWIADGKASLVRAIQVASGLSKQLGWEKAFRRLLEAD